MQTGSPTLGSDLSPRVCTAREGLVTWMRWSLASRRNQTFPTVPLSTSIVVLSVHDNAFHEAFFISLHFHALTLQEQTLSEFHETFSCLCANGAEDGGHPGE